MDKLCNLCGESCCHNEEHLSGTWKSDQPHGLIDAQVIGGYESYHLLDLNGYTFSLCEKCLRQLFIQFKIKPQVHNMTFPMIIDANSKLEQGEEESWDRDQGSYEYRVWCDAGKHHEAYLNKKCNGAVDCPNDALFTVYLSDEFTEDAVCIDHTTLWSRTINAKLVPFIPQVLKPFL